MNLLVSITPEQLRKAAQIQERILSLQAQFSEILGSGEVGAAARAGQRRHLSAQGLANIRAGARKRWASLHAKRDGNGAKPKRKSKMSHAGRARIAAALKARWAAAKKAGRNAL